MQKTIVYIGMSLDGFIAGVNDDLSWLMPFQDVDYGYQDFFSTVGVVIKGKRAHEIEVSKGWENAHPVPVFVLAHNPSQVKTSRTDVTITSEDITSVLKKAKQMTDKNIWIEGGAHIVQEFLNKKLVDEIVITIIPVFLTEGIRLFEHIDNSVHLSMKETKTFKKGLIQITYEAS